MYWELDLWVILLACHLSPFHQLFKACVYAYVYTMHVCSHMEVNKQAWTSPLERFIYLL